MLFAPAFPLWVASKFGPMVCLYPLVIEYGANLVADSIVKVPQMAESITEGTLKQFSKRMISVCSLFLEGLLTRCRGWRLRRAGRGDRYN